MESVKSVGATKGQQAMSRGQQQQVAAHSPAFNSRQKTSSFGVSQQQTPFKGAPEQTPRQQRLGSINDNQMAADDMHETQAYMPSTRQGPKARGQEPSATSEQGQEDEAKAMMRTTSGSRQQQQQVSSAGSSEARPQAMAMNGNGVGGKPAMSMVNQVVGKQSPSKSSPPSTMGQPSPGTSAWQTVSTSVPSVQGSSPSTSSAMSSMSSTWAPPRQRSHSGQKYLPPPPPPTNYNNFYYSQKTSAQMDQINNAGTYQAQLQQQLADQLESTQLERPTSGYSYGSPAYTHTVQLAPARLELEAANEQQQQLMITSSGGPPSARQRQRQFVAPADQLGRTFAPTPTSASSHLEQQQISTPRLASGQQSHLSSSSVHYSQQAPTQHNKPHVQLGMMPPPLQPPVTGTHSNPCKPPLLQLGLQQQQQQQLQEQLLLSNDLASAASSQQQQSSSSTSMPRYVRLGDGTRLRSQFIFKVLRADSLTDCELACANPLDTCRSFNYRAYFAAENCELSRSDSRQLKLDDSNQFELHTQFDFYASVGNLDHSPAGGSSTTNQNMQMHTSAQLQQAPPIVQQQVVAPYTPAPQDTDCLDVSQSCSQDGMDFTLRTLEPFTGRIYTYGFYESCYFDGDGQMSSTLRISRSNGFPRCGTQQIGDLMTNIVVVQFNDHVQTSRDKKYNLTCYFSGPGEAVVTSSYFDTKIDERSHPMQIEHLPPQNVITSNVQLRILHHGTPTNTIAVGDLLTFRLETQQQGSKEQSGSGSSGVKQGRAGLSGGTGGQSSERQHEIFATNVIAKDPYSGRQVQLIDARGCPVDPVNVFPELQRTTDGALESEFYAFKMPDSNFLIFQATVRACKSPCEPVICHRTSVSGSSLAGPSLSSMQQYQMASGSSGIKGHQQQLGAYLMAASQQNAVPSWGRRRRRKRQSQILASTTTTADTASQQQTPDDDRDDELIGSGESIEHVIPVRLGGVSNNNQPHFDHLPLPSRPVITRVKRPELSEAEEEVKEMFRVYLTRAEINNKRRLAQQQQQQQQLQFKDLELTAAGSDGLNARPQSGSLVLAPSSGNTSSSAIDDDIQTSAVTGSAQLVCLTHASYYVLLFSIIALSLIVVSVLLIAFYITKKAKFHISETLADAMF